MNEHRRAARVAAAGLAVHLCGCAVLLYVSGGDPAGFVHFGAQSPVLPLGQQRLGAVPTPNRDGHDGQFFWVLAHDPLLRDAAFLTAHLDRPAYRAQRIAYPALAAPWASGGERALLWGLLLTNLMVVGAGGYAAARLAQALSITPAAGIAFALNPGIFIGVGMDLSDPLALLGVVVALLGLARRQLLGAAAGALLATLAKEPSLMIFAALAVWPGRGVSWRARAAIIAAPLLGAGAWAAYVVTRLGSGRGIVEFGLPFVGYWHCLRAVDMGAGHGRGFGDAVVATLLLLLCGSIAWRWSRRRSLLLTAALPFVLLFPLLSFAVLGLATNALRALAPALLLFWMDVYPELGKRKTVGAA